LQVGGEGLEDLAGSNDFRVLAALWWDVDGDLGVGVDGVELDLLNACWVVGGGGVFGKFGGADFDFAIGFVDVVAEKG